MSIHDPQGAQRWHLTSMTGFGHAVIREETMSVELSIRSVNQKNLDVKISIEEHFSSLTERIQIGLKNRFSRGRLDVSCVITTESSESSGIFQEERLNEMAAGLEKCRQALPTFDATVRLSDVVAWALSNPQRARLNLEKIEVLVDRAVQAAAENLLMMRRKEGALLTKALLPMYEKSVKVVNDIAAFAETDFFARYELLKKRVKGLLESGEIAEERLYQECALLAEKSDFKEEVDRLLAHFVHFDDVCQNELPKGRLLDFICQEMLRETNTLMSKAFQSSVTKEAIQLRAEVERLREQIQNIE